MVEEYWCFVIDFKGIGYRIPVSKREEFYDWDESCQNGYQNNDFLNFRCMHPVNYMFKIEDLKVLKES